MKILITALIAFGFFCSCNNANDFSIWSDKYCKLERLEYQEVEDTARVTTNGNIEGGVVANGKIIATDKINLDTLKAYLNAGQKVFINQSTKRIVKVSQDFYEQYNKNRTSLCQIVEGVKSGIISSDEGKKRAEQEYLDMVRFFSGMDANGSSAKATDSTKSRIDRLTTELKKRTSFITSLLNSSLQVEDVRSLEASLVGNIDYLSGWYVSRTNYYVYDDLKKTGCDALINELNNLKGKTMNVQVQAYSDVSKLFEKLKAEAFKINKIRADRNPVELSSDDKKLFQNKILPNLIQ
jgi:hypothetical protein